MTSYTELHCHTNYSLLDGASHPEDLVARAAELGMDALAVVDHQGLYGAVRFWKAAEAAGVRPVYGVEMTLDDGFNLVLLARDQEGYSNLCRLVSHAQLAGRKGQAALDRATLAAHAGHLHCLTAFRKGEVGAHLLEGRRREALAAARRYARLFGAGALWIELQDHLLPEDHWLVDELVEVAERLGLGCVATNNVHYAHREGHRLQDVLVCIANRTTLDQSSHLRFPNAEYYLKSAQEMGERFARYPGALANTHLVADACRVELGFARYRFPGVTVPDGETPFSHLYHLCQEGAGARYPLITPEVSRQLAHELDVIYKTGLAEFFLIVWDIMRYAREQGIPGQGRGSAADSIVAYVLGITKVDPIRHNLLFERFLSEERAGTPDIDVDFSSNHREQIIQYVYEKYGQEHTAMVCNVVTFQARGAVRDVGKVLGFPPATLDRLAKQLDRHRSSGRELREEIALLLVPGTAPTPEAGPPTARARSDQPEASVTDGPAAPPEPWQHLVELCAQIDGFPRHLSIHVGGMLITATPLVDIVPLERATAPGRVVCQFNKDDVEDLGLIKMDILGLRTLSLIHDALALIRAHRGIDLDLERLSLDDPAVYDLLCRADTVGTFQVESRAQAQLLPRMKPRCFEDIIVAISIIRPGPIQGHMVHPYLQRRAGLEEVVYPHPRLEPILSETLGVILFQEQVIKVAMAIAGFRPGEADLLRRAMGGHRSRAAMEKLHDRFVAGAEAQGIEGAVAEEIFRQLAGFAEYGFCKSHAAAFAKTSYDTLYLKAHYPTEFYTALLNNQPMGFYAPAVVVNDARRHGVAVLPVDLNRGRARCTMEGGGVRMGFSYVDGIGEAAGQRLEAERERGPYGALAEFCRRTRLERAVVQNLVRIGAADSFGVPRRRLLWELEEIYRDLRQEGLALDWSTTPEPELPPLTAAEEVIGDYSVLGLSPTHHLMDLYRPQLAGTEVVPAADLAGLPTHRRVRVAGMVVVRQAPPTAKGHVFLTLEDETGLSNIILRPDVYQRHRRIVRGSLALVVEGRLQQEDGVTSVLGQRLRALDLPAPQPEAAPPAGLDGKGQHNWR